MVGYVWMQVYMLSEKELRVLYLGLQAKGNELSHCTWLEHRRLQNPAYSDTISLARPFLFQPGHPFWKHHPLWITFYFKQPHSTPCPPKACSHIIMQIYIQYSFKTPHIKGQYQTYQTSKIQNLFCDSCNLLTLILYKKSKIKSQIIYLQNIMAHIKYYFSKTQGREHNEKILN